MQAVHSRCSRSHGARAVAALALTASMVVLAHAGGDGSSWVRVTNNRPSARQGHAMATDTLRNRVVLFGGWNGEVLNDTWEWDGIRWRRITPTGGVLPQPRWQHAMAFDEHRQRIVMCGGVDGDHDIDVFDDTWEWDGLRWRRVAVNGPEVFGHALAYDATRRNTVLFGGTELDDLFLESSDTTCTWDGSTWRVASTSGPDGRDRHAMAYDAHRQRIVMYGGRELDYSGIDDFDEDLLSDTWEWNGQQWISRPQGVLFAREMHAMAWDPVRQRVVMFGGRTEHGNLKQTLEWTGQQWVVMNQHGPSARFAHAMAFDPNTQKVLMYGGRSHQYWKDTWCFGP